MKLGSKVMLRTGGNGEEEGEEGKGGDSERANA